MGYHTLLQLEVSRDAHILYGEEWNECLNQIDDLTIDKDVLREIYGDGIETSSSQWIYEHKDNIMHKVSSLFPDLTFELCGDGEDHGDDWIETWKNGKRVKFSCRLSMADCMMNSLKNDHPTIYQKYVTDYYKIRRGLYDDNTIVIEDLEIDNISSDEIPSVQGFPVIPTVQSIVPNIPDAATMNTRIHVVEIRKGLYLEPRYNLLLTNQNLVVSCHGTFNKDSKEILPLTSKEIELCKELMIEVGEAMTTIDQQVSNN